MNWFQLEDVLKRIGIREVADIIGEGSTEITGPSSGQILMPPPFPALRVTGQESSDSQINLQQQVNISWAKPSSAKELFCCFPVVLQLIFLCRKHDQQYNNHKY